MSISLGTINVDYINVNDPISIAERMIEIEIKKGEDRKKSDDWMNGIRNIFSCCFGESTASMDSVIREIQDKSKKKGFETIQAQLKDFTVPSICIERLSQEQRIYIITQQILLARITAFNLLLLGNCDKMYFKNCVEEIHAQLDTLISLDQRFSSKKEQLGVDDLSGKKITKLPYLSSMAGEVAAEERMKEIFRLYFVARNQLAVSQKEIEESNKINSLQQEAESKVAKELNKTTLDTYEAFCKDAQKKACRYPEESTKFQYSMYTAVEIYESVRKQLNDKDILTIKLNKANVELANECEKINSILEPLKKAGVSPSLKRDSMSPVSDTMDESYFHVESEADADLEKVTLLPKVRSPQTASSAKSALKLKKSTLQS